MPFGRFTQKAQYALERAQQMAWERHQGEMRALHLLYILLSEEDFLVQEILTKGLNVKIEELLKEVMGEIIKLPRIFTVGEGVSQMYLSPEMIQIIESTAKKSIEEKNDFISPEYLFYGILNSKSSACDVLAKYNIKKENYLKALFELSRGEKITDEFQGPTGTILDKYSYDLVQMARENKLDPVIGREEELRRVMQILSRRTKNNPVLIGEAGVGKTAIVEGLAQRIAQGEVPEILKDKKIISLDIGALIAGTRFRGEFEERLKKVLKEIQQSKNIITFIDELHTLIGAGAAEGAIDASNLLKPALARGELRMIGAATYKDYRERIERDPALERRFQPVTVEEPSIEETISILRGLKEKYEAHHGLRISEDALVAAVNLSSRYITARFLPDKAIDLIDEAASSLSLEIGSVPLPVAEIEKRIKPLELEKEAIKKENKVSFKSRQKEVEKEIKKFKRQLEELKGNWQKEKEIFNTAAEIKKEIEKLKGETQEEERKGNLEKVAEILYGRIPALVKELKLKEKILSQIPSKKRFLKEEVTGEDIARIVSRWTGIPVIEIIEEESKKLSRMEAILSRRVVGQNQAISAVARAIRRARAGISEEDRPLGSFMFLGPTGVGKTELARALAEFMFADEKSMVRMDMSEYMEKHSVARLIGSPPGYVGYEEGGQLTEIVKHRPYSLILFDEIEKAHPEVFNILLQILDNGRLTDGKGRTVNFRNTIIIMTSNLGGEYIREMASLGFTYGKNTKMQSQKENLKTKILEALRNYFRPEFLNRIDEIVIFDPLGPPEIEKIVNLQVEKIIKRLLSKEIQLELTKEAKEYLAKKGYDPNYGARPLKRLIEREILDFLADRIISGGIKAKNKILVKVKNNSLFLQTINA